MHYNIEALNEHAQALQRIQQRYRQVALDWSTCRQQLETLPVPVSLLLQKDTLFRQLQDTLEALIQFIQTDAQIYGQLENTLNHEAMQLPELEKPFFDIATHTFEHALNWHTNLSSSKSIVNIIQNGLRAGAEFTFDIAGIELSKHMKYLDINGGAHVGEGSVSGNAKAILYQDRKIQPQLNLGIVAEATLAGIHASIHTGNAYISADVDGRVGIGVVKGEAKAVISKDEITLKAEVGAAAVRGEVKGSISLFGLRIDATASGDIGSIGAGAEFSTKKNAFEIGGHASFLAGVGLKIKVTYD